MVLSPKKPAAPTIHHRKRTGSHHKQTKPYHRTYWPYLPLFGIAGFALLLNLAWPSLPIGRGHGSVLGSAQGISSLTLLDETNQDRAALGIDTLDVDTRLSAAAQSKAQDMVSNDYWSHRSPSGSQPQDFATKAGYGYRAIGENLAYGFSDSDTVIQAWLKSPEHRANLLDPAFRDVGFGVVKAADYQGKGPQTIVVALYGASDTTMGVQAYVDNPSSLPARSISRTSLLTGTGSDWLFLGLILMAAIGAGIFIGSHIRGLYRTVVHGAEFVVAHPHVDLAVVTVIAVAVLLTRTAGFIN